MSDEIIPPTQSDEPDETGPRLNTSGEMSNEFPLNETETVGILSHGTKVVDNISDNRIDTHGRLLTSIETSTNGTGSIRSSDGLIKRSDIGGISDDQGSASINNGRYTLNDLAPTSA